MKLKCTFAVLYMALVAATGDKMIQTEVTCGQKAVLRCAARPKPAVQYRAVRWYKEGASPRLSGLLSKDLPDGRMRWYVGASTENSLFNQTLDLLLPNVSCSHSGVYQCYLAAPVGEQNREGRVRLTVADCPLEEEEEEVVEVQKSPVVRVERRDLEVVGAGVVLLVLALALIGLVYSRLNNRLRLKSKSLEREWNPHLHPPPEKQGLVPSPICTVSPCLQKSIV